jgi:folate-dependent phosphoribosylglycinamide formyltransferase PurN
MGDLVGRAQSEILLLGQDNPTTWIVYNRLVRELGLFPAIIEEPVPRLTLLRNRARRLGWPRVLSQAAFATLIRPVLRYQAARRIRVLCKRHDLERVRPMTLAIQHVTNINAPDTIAAIQKASPRIVILNGTRILKPATLKSLSATFINTHQGITPVYRGAHGAYWAQYENDAANCGVTVHLVDEGIDTGAVVGQARITPERADCFVTYPYLQTAAALPLLMSAIRDALAGQLKSIPVSGPSAVWYHPGAIQYLKARLRGVR